MTTYTDLELDEILDQFLASGPSEAPDLAIEAALDRIDGIGQRRRSWMDRLRAAAPASSTSRLVLVVALMALALAVGALLVASQRDTEVPKPTPALATPSAPAPATPSLAPSPSRTAAATPTARPSTPPTAATLVPQFARAAIRRVESVITGARGPTGLSEPDQSRLLQLTDALSFPLEEGGNTGAAKAALPALEAAIAERRDKLGEDDRARMDAAMRALRDVLDATLLASGERTDGTVLTTSFGRGLAFDLPAGWTRREEDREVVVLARDGATLSFTRTAPEATAAGLAKALGTGDPASLAVPPEATSFPSYRGFVAEATGGGTLWINERLQAFDAAPTDRVRAWVMAAGGSLTIILSGPPEAVDAALPDVEAMLDTILVR